MPGPRGQPAAQRQRSTQITIVQCGVIQAGEGDNLAFFLLESQSLAGHLIGDGGAADDRRIAGRVEHDDIAPYAACEVNEDSRAGLEVARDFVLRIRADQHRSLGVDGLDI